MNVIEVDATLAMWKQPDRLMKRLWAHKDLQHAKPVWMKANPLSNVEDIPSAETVNTFFKQFTTDNGRSQ